MKKVALYVRVSTDEQAKVEEGSLKNQIQELNRFVDAENLKQNGSWGGIFDTYIDDGYSAKNLKRPQITRLMSDISKGRVDTVLITEISRFSRATNDLADVQRYFEKHNVQLLATRQNFDISTPAGKLMINLMGDLAQLERETIVDRSKRGYQSRASRGLFTGGPVPYGLVTTDKPGYLKINEEYQIIANELLDILLEKAGYVSKAVELYREAGFVREGGKAWDDNSLIRWIRSRALVGEIELNRKNKNKDQDKLKEDDRYRVISSQWPCVVDKDKWLRANALLDENYCKRKVTQWKYAEFLLTGLVECPKGRRLVGGSGHGRSGKKHSQYRHQKKCGCHFFSIPIIELEKVVIGVLKEIAMSPECLASLISKANEEFKKVQPDYKKAVLAAQRRLDGINSRLSKATDMRLEAISADEKVMWAEKCQLLFAEKNQASREVSEFEKKKDKMFDGLIDTDNIRAALVRLLENFDKLALAAKLGLIRSLIDKVVIQKEEMVIYIKGPEVVVPIGKKYAKTEERESVICESGDQKDDERKIWGDQRGLNPRQPESQSGALPTELWPPQKSKRPCCYIELLRQNQEP